MVKETTTLQQTIFKKAHEPIQVTLLDEVDLNVSVLSDFLQTAVQNDVGLATVHGPKGVLRALAFSSPSHALYVRFCKPGGKKVGRRAQAGVTGSPKTPRIILTEQLLCNPSYRKLAFDMHHVAAALYFDHGLYIKNAIDLQSAQREQRFRSTLRTLSDVLGGDTVLNTSQVAYNFLGHGLNSDLAHNACLRAWACCRVRSSTHWNLNLMGARQIDTEVMQKKHLIVICKFVRDAQRLEALKPTIVKNNVKAEFSCKDGVLQLECTHFSSRLRRSKTQKIVVTAGSKQGSQITAKGRTVQVKGKRASVSLDKPISSKYTDIRSVQTFGRDDPSPADAERTRVLLSIFQSTTNVLHQPLAVRIFSLIDPPLSPRSKQVPRACQSSPPEIDFTARPLNASQQRAVRRVLSDDIAHRVCLIHGPPGTGKTTVIAACVSSILARSNVKEGVWLVAQSNVAVKNIAEKLAEFGLEDFKLLVSKDFHFEWHEHLYEKIKPKVIRTDMFGAGGRVGTERRLLGSRVMLCTLSMFSYPRFLDGEFSRIVPVNTVLVDEASQIELGSYLPLLHNFGDMIQKLAFIGDDKQLAPYGQDDIGDLRSIFEVPGLHRDAIFLDTQYRMPETIGSFISKHVYNGRLKTVHSFNDALTCRFVDIPMGKEIKSGNSFVNEHEANVTIALVRIFHARGKTFRIITPYDAQRGLIERRLKAENLPWEDKCFNVDSFQGHEADHILISVVRSEKVGFLVNPRRVNVMLSRCKRSMIICTSRSFLADKAAATLVGKLANESGSTWLSRADVLSGRF